MKRYVVLAVIGLSAWYVYHARIHPPRPVATAPAVPSRAGSMLDGGEGASRFHCDGRKYCSQMRSRAEAVYFTRHCPDARMDGDHDGIPCENDSRF